MFIDSVILSISWGFSVYEGKPYQTQLLLKLVYFVSLNMPEEILIVGLETFV